MQNKCFWGEAENASNNTLSGNISTQFLIIGAGVAGLFTAYFLLKHGVAAKDIVIIERNRIGSGSTGHSAGMLISDIETAPWSKVYSEYGKDNASLYYKAQKDALDEVEKIIIQEKIDCDFARRDYLIVSGDAEGLKKVISEFKVHQTLGDQSTEILKNTDFTEELSSPLYSLGERLEKGISVNPLQFIHGVGVYLKQKGVRIYENTSFIEAKDSMAHVPNGSIRFISIIYAQGTAAKNEQLQNYTTTIAISKPLTPEELESLHLSDKDMFIDTETPSFHYVKVLNDNRLLVGCGDEKTDSTEAVLPLDTKMFEKIQKFANQFTQSTLVFNNAWTGVFSLSRASLPYVFVSQEKSILAGMGTQIASIAIADYIAAMLTKKEHPLQALFANK